MLGYLQAKYGEQRGSQVPGKVMAGDLAMQLVGQALKHSGRLQDHTKQDSYPLNGMSAEPIEL